MKRAILAGVAVLAVLIVGYGYTLTRKERLYRQLVAQGDEAIARGDTFAGLTAFGDAVALNPDSMLGYLKRGDAHRRRGELDTAAADLERAITLDPTAPRALEMLGDVETARHLYDKAADHYAACVQLDDRSPQVLYKLGLARQLDGRHAQAADALRHAVKLDGRFAEAHYLLGISLRQMKQLAAAQTAFERAVGVSPTLLAAREELAELYGVHGRRQDRIRQLEELLSADASPARQIAVALAYADTAQTTRAVRLLRLAAELYPDHADTYVALGRVWLDVAAEGRDRVALSKAIEALQHAVSMEPSSAALTLLGQARLAASDPVAAERTLRQATETLPAEPAAFLHLADAAERTGHPQIVRRALVDYQALTGTGDVRFLVRMAQAQLEAGDTAAARHTLSRALEREPANAEARALERRLR